MKIAIVGTGYVGLVTGTCFAETGHEVVCVDVDAKKIDTLRKGGIPIYEPGLEELVHRNVRERRLSFTTSYAEAIPGADVAFIAVGTPPGETGEADLSYVLSAAGQIGASMTGYLVVVDKSTVPVGSAEKVAETLRKVTSHPFDVVSNPEFLKEGAAIDDFMRPDRVVVGVASERARSVMSELYSPFVRAEQPILFMDLRSAELTKYAANAMLATRISFMNEMAALCERLGADVDQVRRGIGSDKRIGHPFLFPGVGFGGSCLAGAETVLARHRGRTRLVSLEGLFDALEAATGASVPDAAAIVPPDLEVLAWRPDGKSAFCRVAAVTRRPFEGEAIEVRTKMGRRVLCTPDHPFVASDRSGAASSVKRADELTSSDWLPIAVGTAVGEVERREPQRLDLLSAVPLAGLEPANVIVHPSSEQGLRLAAMGPSAVRAAIAPLAHPRRYHRAYDVLRSGALRLPELRATGLSLKGARLSTVKNGTRVPAEIAADESFWRVVGLYLAEGHCSADGARRRLHWSFHPTKEVALANEVAGYWHGLGVKADVRRGTTALNVSVSSRILSAFWIDALDLGADCYEHHLPDVIWSEPAAHKRALLAGLWRGDGSWSLVNGGPSVVLEWGSVSRALADGVLRVLGELGIVARLKVGRVAKSTVDTYWVVVAGADQVLQLLDFVSPSDRARIRRSIGQQQKRVAPTGYARGSAGAFVRVTGEERRPFRGSVYSLEVPDAHTFVTTGGLAVHNCFPKDVRAVMTMARLVGLDFDLLRSVERVNERQKRWLVEKAAKHFGTIAGKTFGVWGLAFKPKTDDMREAPSITVVEGLLGNGAKVRAHDPVARQVASKLFDGRPIEFTDEPYGAAQGADALLLLTEWNEFRQPDFARLRRIMKQPVLFDGRNVWDGAKARAAGFTYYGVGRSGPE
jgi:UDPglucose 6-dehydrogenase